MPPRFATLPNRRAIIDRRVLADELAAIDEHDTGKRRVAGAMLLKRALEAGKAEIERRFAEHPTRGLETAASQAFLTDFKPDFHTVRILTRDPSSATAQDLAVKGAQLRTFDESDLARSLDEALEGIDVVVNVLPGKTPDEVKRAVIDAAARSRVKVYFLDEYGL